MDLPRNMATKEEELRGSRGPEYSLLDDVIRQVNDGGRNLSEVAEDIGVNRYTLEGWLTYCGYRYQLEKRLVPIRPVALAGGE